MTVSFKARVDVTMLKMAQQSTRPVAAQRPDVQSAHADGRCWAKGRNVGAVSGELPELGVQSKGRVAPAMKAPWNRPIQRGRCRDRRQKRRCLCRSVCCRVLFARLNWLHVVGSGSVLCERPDDARSSPRVFGLGEAHCEALRPSVVTLLMPRRNSRMCIW